MGSRKITNSQESNGKMMGSEFKKDIESKFVFKEKIEYIFYMADDEGHKLGFASSTRGNKLVLTECSEGIPVTIEYFPDGKKVYHMEEDSKGLPAMHEFCTDGTEFIHLFNDKYQLEKMVQIKESKDKVTTWFSGDGNRIITQEQRQSSGIVFKINDLDDEATIWLKKDGHTNCSGPAHLLKHLEKVFKHHLDGLSRITTS